MPDRRTIIAWLDGLAARVRRLNDVRDGAGMGAALRSVGPAALAALRSLKRRAANDVAYAPAEIPLDPRAAGQPPLPAVLYAGYVEAALGLGQSLRGLIDAAAGQSFTFAIFPYNWRVEKRHVGPFRPELYDFEQRYKINVVEVSPDETADFLAAFGPERLADSRNILRPYWELPAAPASWREPLSHFHELWSPSAFVTEALRPVFDGPIVVIPPAVDVSIGRQTDRAAFGLPPGAFCFLFTFDLNSFPARKNPFGLVRAFQKAFPDPSTEVALAIKVSGEWGLFEEYRTGLRTLAAADPRIRLLEVGLDRDGILSLMKACDCYVSLHRSEGLGLGMVESMMLGKPVIGTDFSGSRDFLDVETGFPVPYQLVGVRAHDYPHAAGQRWADPDLDAAATAMRTVREKPDEAARRAAVGRERAIARYGAAAVGAAQQARIDAILAAMERGVAP